MDFNMKKIVKDAGAALSRVVQLTEEKLGTSEKTELDGHFENLWERAENTKSFTEKIVRNAEAVLIPNPGNRIEDYIYEKIEKKRPSRLSNLEYLGIEMVEAGNAFGPGTAYGNSLIKVGQWEQKLGQTDRDFIGSAGMCFTQPLRKFLETEMRTIMKEKNLLETKRLDLDACKNRVRKARSMLGQPSAERDLRIAQSEFDRQAEITKLLLEGISSSHAAHLRCLHEFVDTQARFYSQCTTIMTDLQRELASLSGVPPTPNNSMQTDDSPTEDMMKARVLYDYEAKDSTELSLTANEDASNINLNNQEDYHIPIVSNDSQWNGIKFTLPKDENIEHTNCLTDIENEIKVIELDSEENSSPLLLLFPELKSEELNVKNILNQEVSTTDVTKMLVGKKPNLSLLKPCKKLNTKQWQLASVEELTESEISVTIRRPSYKSSEVYKRYSRDADDESDEND